MRLRPRIRPALPASRQLASRLIAGSLLVGTLLLGSACSGDPTGPAAITLTPGVAITVSGRADSEREFRIQVPPGTPGLNVTLSGASGDADLYVRFASLPTPDEYDCGSESFGGDEICFLPTPEAGMWYIVIYGFESYSGGSLLATFSDGPSATPLTAGVPITNVAGVENSLRFFSIALPAGSSALNVTTAGGSGDVDLFVLRDFNETMANCASTNDGNDEICSIANPEAGTWYVALQGFFEYSGVTLSATISTSAAVGAAGTAATILQGNATPPTHPRALRALRSAAQQPRGPRRTR